MLKRIFLIAIVVCVVLADQAVKIFLAAFLRPSDTIPVIKNVFHITLVYNTGCAFGLFRGNSNLLFLFISVCAAIFLLYFLVRLNRRATFLSQAGAVLIISGAVSNIIDRLRIGYVIDFLDFRIWPVFNLGDTAITIGILVLCIRYFLK